MATCSVSKVLAPNYKESIQFNRIKAEITPYTEAADVHRRALEIWLGQHTNEFADRMNRQRRDFVESNTLGLTPAEEESSRIDAEKKWLEEHEENFDENGELKFETYYQADKYRDAPREDWMTSRFEEFEEANGTLKEQTSAMIDAQIQIITEIANRSKLTNIGGLTKKLESAKDHEGRSMVVSLVKQSSVLIDGSLYSLRKDKDNAPSFENDALMYENYRLAKAFTMLGDLLGPLTSNDELSSVYSEEIKLLKEAVQKLDDAKTIYSNYLYKSVSQRMAGISQQYSADDILKLLKEADFRTTGASAGAQAAIDSGDAVIALVAKLISERQDTARREIQKIEDHLSATVGRLEKYKGTTNQEKMYENFVIKDENGNLTNKWLSYDNTQYQEFLRNGDPTEVAIYKEMRELFLQMQDYLPSSFRNDKYIPSVSKKAIEKFLSTGSFVKEVQAEMSQRFLTNNPTDADYGNVDESGNPIDYVPIYFTNRMDKRVYDKNYERLVKAGKSEEIAEAAAIKIAEEDFSKNTVSKDLGNSIMAFAAMAVNYKEMNKIVFTAEGVRDLVSIRSNATANRPSNMKFAKAYDKSSNKNAIAQLEGLMASQLYGVNSENLGSISLNENKINIDIRKTAQTLQAYNSLLLMGMNMMAAQVNVLMGESMNIIESVAGEHFNTKEMLWANKQYMSEVATMASDVTRRKPKSKISLMLRHYDILGNYRAEKADAGHGTFKQMNLTSAAMFLSSAGEHMIQSKAFLAKLRATKVYDSNGKEKGNLYDAHEVVDGQVKIKADTYVKNLERQKVSDKKSKTKHKNVEVLTEYSVKQEQKITRNTQEMLRRMHGNYNAQTSVNLQRNAIYSLAYQFRKWIPSGFERRFGAGKYSEAADDFREGNYRSTAIYLGRLYSELKESKYAELGSVKKTMTQAQQANLRRTTTEVGMLTMLIASNIALTTAVEADDDPIYNNFVYVVNRLSNELQFFINPIAIFEIVRAPAASVSTIQSIGDVILQLMPWNWGDKYISGRHKDESKLLVNSKKLIPLYKQLDSVSPEGLKARVDFILN